ncbi:MAG TPA: pyrroloquinoline quinone-dependent dehydrogenase [Candidatus Cybelea sp.]|nr:pyrroloquinoline quinone-dependent dehydrogenase [Candidatus Cybelea sp.]
MRTLLAAVAVLLSSVAQAQEWPAYGGDDGGSRYSNAAQIDRSNVAQLTAIWTYHTGEAERRGELFRRAAFENTPQFANGKLLVCSPFDRLIALDPASGKEIWVFDPNLPRTLRPGNQFVCRGVAVWHDTSASAKEACATRAFMATVDTRLFAIDVETGRPCAGFGHDGFVEYPPDIPPLYNGEYQSTSAPTVAGGVVLVGTAMDDATRVRAPLGRVYAYDLRTGALRWSFSPIPQSADDPAAATWEGGSWARVGGGEMWSTASFDAARNLVFLPTGGPTGTFFGGTHPGANLHTDSVVALNATTGKLVWSFQTVHHDIWDYDLAAQPSLAVVHRDGRDIPAVIEATKMGLVFVLDRETGKPIFPVEERAVPKSDAPGEAAAETEPFPVAPPPIVPETLKPENAWGILWFDKRACARQIAALRSDGLYTPPSVKGTAEFPFTGGGVNWGSGAVDPKHGLYIVNTNRLIHLIRLIPRADVAKERAAAAGKTEIGQQLGAPFGFERRVLLSPLGLPCNAPPWGMLTAVDINAGTIKWNATLGTVPENTWAPPFKLGTPGFGGPIVTAGGLVFIGAALDSYIRAFDVETGAELWKARLPFGGQATPMTYEVDGRQYVVIAAGGFPRSGNKLGDAVVAFALPK